MTKRITSLILVTMLVVSLFAFVGCSNTDEMQQKIEELQATINQMEDEIAFLETQIPKYDGNNIEFSAQSPIYKNPQSHTTVASFEQIHFEDFLEYYQKEIKPKHDNDIYLLAPMAQGMDIYREEMYRTYSVLAESFDEQQIVNPMIYERLKMYAEGLGEHVVSPSYKVTRWSIDLEIYLSPIAKGIKESNVYLEFGNNNQDDIWGTDYINIYLNEDCIGTCYYKTNTYVSKNWFERYFYEKLIRA